MVETGEKRSVSEAEPSDGETADRETATDRSDGRISSLKARARATRDAATESLEAARQRSRVVDACTTIVLRPRIVADTILAGYLALRLFILLFPLAYMVVAGLGIYRSEASGDPAEVATDVGLAPAVTSSIVEASRSSSRGHWLALFIGLVGTLWAARGLVRALRGMFSLIWGLPMIKTSVSVIAPLLTAAGVIGLILMSSWFDRLRREGVPWWVVSIIAVVLQGGLWLLVSLNLPHASTRWYNLAPGAVVFSVGLQGLNVATTLYFGPKVGSASAAYGALGIGLVLLSWLVVLGWVVALSAEVNAGLHHWRSGRTTVAAHTPATQPVGGS